MKIKISKGDIKISADVKIESSSPLFLLTSAARELFLLENMNASTVAVDSCSYTEGFIEGTVDANGDPILNGDMVKLFTFRHPFLNQILTILYSKINKKLIMVPNNELHMEGNVESKIDFRGIGIGVRGTKDTIVVNEKREYGSFDIELDETTIGNITFNVDIMVIPGVRYGTSSGRYRTKVALPNADFYNSGNIPLIVITMELPELGFPILDKTISCGTIVAHDIDEMIIKHSDHMDANLLKNKILAFTI